MKGKFGIVALLVSSITFAGPVSAPNNLSDTPIISGGGTVSGGGTCMAYQTDGTVVNLSGGETLVFYGGGANLYQRWDFSISGRYRRPIGWRISEGIPPSECYRDHPIYSNLSVDCIWHGAPGGFLSTKTTYSGTTYLKVRRSLVNVGEYAPYLHLYSSGIGLFTSNSTNKADFIAGAAGAYASIRPGVHDYALGEAAAGGGWDLIEKLYSGHWFGTPINHWICERTCGFRFFGIANGFNNGLGVGLSGNSSISAFYNYHTKRYTSLATSFTITGGGNIAEPALLYVCQ